MAIEIEIKDIQRRAGRVHIQFDEAPSFVMTLEDLRTKIRELKEDKTTLRILALAFLLERSDDASDLSSIIGKKMVLDFTSETPLHTRTP